uniref:Uncharacterized protein n=1 Tax=Plectus sambesii TaxID=2011161 RepID=A0A914VE93_9BILA
MCVKAGGAGGRSDARTADGLDRQRAFPRGPPNYRNLPWRDGRSGLGPAPTNTCLSSPRRPRAVRQCDCERFKQSDDDYNSMREWQRRHSDTRRNPVRTFTAHNRWHRERERCGRGSRKSDGRRRRVVGG